MILEIVYFIGVFFRLNKFLHVAMKAPEGSNIRVSGKQMPLEMKRSLEGLTTLRARLMLDIIMRKSGVLRKFLSGLERLCTERTHE